MRLIFSTLFANLIIICFCHAQPVVMYPGDANNDGTANYLDLLPIGIAYGQMGPPRLPASLNWTPQLAEPWQPLILPVSHIDLAFEDSNGDGKIDSLDIEAIALNYDSLQANSMPPPFPYIERLTQFCFSCATPSLAVSFDRDTVGSLDTFSATFTLRYPPNVLPAQGALGIAFGVEYDYDPDKIIDSLTRIFPDTIPDDRLYVVARHTGVSTAGLLPPAGKFEFAAAGKGENVYYSTKTLFTAKFIIEDMIILEEQEVSELFSFKIDPQSVLILNELEQIIGLDSVILDSVVVSTKAPHASEQPLVRIAPNPVRDVLILESFESPIEKVEIQSITGKHARSVRVNRQNHFELPVATLPPGIWMVVVQTKQGVTVRKFVKTE